MSSIVKPGIFRNKPEVASCYVIHFRGCGTTSKLEIITNAKSRSTKVHSTLDSFQLADL